MAPSPTALRHPLPPPTSNRLDPSQRARIQRSARKIGKLLGTTPYLMETSSEIPISLLPIGPRTHSPTPSIASSSSPSTKSVKSLRRRASVFTHSQVSFTSSAASSVTSLTLPHSSSLSSLDLPSTQKLPTRRLNDANRPCPLVLHLNPVPVSPSDPRATSFSPTPSPTSASFTPITPVFTEADKAEVRRRKMAKITRTLGENVPPEFVFFQGPVPMFRPRAPPASRHQIRNRNRRSISISGAPQPMWSTGPANLQGGWVGEWNRHDIRDVQKQLRSLKAR